MLTILRELWIMLILTVSFFCRAIAAIFRAIKIGFEKLDNFCIKLSDSILQAYEQTGYKIDVTLHTKNEQ